MQSAILTPNARSLPGGAPVWLRYSRKRSDHVSLIGSSGLKFHSNLPAVLAILLVYVLMRLPGIAVPLDRDEGAFGYIGQTINRGGLPYLDAIDHKPPVGFYINAFALHLVPPTPRGIHSFLLAYNLLSLICVFLLARILFRSRSAALCAAFAFAVFSASPAIHGFTASTEMYALPPTVLSLLFAVVAAEKQSRILFLLSGVCGAGACWTKQTAFTSVLFVLLFVCLKSRRARQWTQPLIWGSGALLFSGALAFYFYAHGIFQQFFYWCFTYELAYASVPLSDTLDAMRTRISEIAAGDFIFPIAGLAMAIWGIFRKRPIGYFLGGFLLFSFLGTIPGYNYAHYFVQLAPAVALAGGYAFYSLLETIQPGKPRIGAAVACSLIILAISVAANRQYFLASDPAAISRHYFKSNPFPEAQTLAAYVASETRDTDRVLVIGSEPEILFYAQRQSPTPFVMIYPLTSIHDRYKEFQKTMWSDVRKYPPKYILEVKNIDSSYAWDGDADLEILHNLSDFIARDYSLQRRVPVGAPQDPDSPVVEVYRKAGLFQGIQPAAVH